MPDLYLPPSLSLLLDIPTHDPLNAAERRSSLEQSIFEFFDFALWALDFCL